VVNEHRTTRNNYNGSTRTENKSMYDKYQQKQQVYESKINPKLMNQQRSNNTKSKNAKMKRAQESHFT